MHRHSYMSGTMLISEDEQWMTHCLSGVGGGPHRSSTKQTGDPSTK